MEDDNADAATEQSPTRVDDQARNPTGDRVASSVQGDGKKAKDRATKHLDRVFASVLASAQQLDPSVDPVTLREELDYRIEFWLDQRSLYAESGHNPHDILREIAKRGGLWERDDGKGQHSELVALGKGAKFGAFFLQNYFAHGPRTTSSVL